MLSLFQQGGSLRDSIPELDATALGKLAMTYQRGALELRYNAHNILQLGNVCLKVCGFMLSQKITQRPPPPGAEYLELSLDTAVRRHPRKIQTSGPPSQSGTVGFAFGASCPLWPPTDAGEDDLRYGFGVTNTTATTMGPARMSCQFVAALQMRAIAATGRAERRSLKKKLAKLMKKLQKARAQNNTKIQIMRSIFVVGMRPRCSEFISTLLHMPVQMSVCILHCVFASSSHLISTRALLSWFRLCFARAQFICTYIHVIFYIYRSM